MNSSRHGSPTREPAWVQALPWHKSLQFKLALLLFGILIVLAISTWVAGDRLVRGELEDDRDRYDRESAQRIADRVSAVSDQVRGLANTLATLAIQAGGAQRNFSPKQAAFAVLPGMIERSGASGLILSAGIWPLPHSTDPSDRVSTYVARDSSDIFALRGDYNDARIPPYSREPWFTPARFVAAGRCYWTAVYKEALTQQDVVSCTMPMGDSRGYAGAVTVTLSLSRLNELFARFTEGSPGYSLLIGRDSRLLGASERATAAFGSKMPTNLVDLVQQLPKFNPLALALHQQDEDFISAAVQTSYYDAVTVSALKDGSRDLSRPDAESALAAVWNQAAQNDDDADDKVRLVRINDDALLDEASFANIVQLPRSYWRVVRVTSQQAGTNGAQYFFNQTLMVIGSACLLAMLLIYFSINWLLMRPLKRMTTMLARSESDESALAIPLDATGDNEIGVLSYWHNERVRQLREVMDRTIATGSQLVVESDERRSAQESLAKTQERATLALQAVGDGVIMTNERGLVEEMNPVAEHMVGLQARSARGQVFSEVFRAHVSGDDLEIENGLPNLAELCMQRGSRLEYINGVLLQSENREVEIYVSVTPIRTRLNRVIGTIVMFRPALVAKTSEEELAEDKRNIDAITGLPNRVACDRALRALLEGVRITAHPHVLLVLDVDHLKRINDTSGQQAGDEVLTRLGESIVSRVSDAGEAFRMGADQFAVVLANFDVDRGRVFAESLRELLGNTRVYWESKAITVTVSIGLTAIAGDASGPVELLRRAEDACAGAKRAGRNSVMIYDDNLDRAERSSDDALWVKRIRAGIDRGLFHLTTQQAVATQTHQTEGQVFDILLALEDEEGFWASPNAFLPVAERHQLLPDMDRWVIRNTLEYLARSPETVERLAFCTVHLSAATLSDESLIEYIATQLQRNAEVAPRKLCFELREEALVAYPNQAQIFCDAMRSLGVHVAVSGFIGRSSSDIAVLRKLSIDFVKVDSLQFRNLGTDVVEQLMAENVRKLAHALRKRLIAGNIGDAAILEAWKRAGADYMQGFAIAKPSPVVFYASGN